jgi:hypothetical protein
MFYLIKRCNLRSMERTWVENWHLVQVTELLFCVWFAWFPFLGGGGLSRVTGNWAGPEISYGLREAFPFLLSASVNKAYSGPFLYHWLPLGHMPPCWFLNHWLKDWETWKQVFLGSWLTFSFLSVLLLSLSSLFQFDLSKLLIKKVKTQLQR